MNGSSKGTEEMSNKNVNELNEERLEWWRFGFSCALAAVQYSLDSLNEADENTIVSDLVLKGHRKLQAAEMLRRLQETAPLLLGWISQKRFPLHRYVQHAKAAAELALEIGIDAAIQKIEGEEGASA